MRTSGIVCEYNPFHNGHLDHMNRVRKLPGSDYVVCVMSSDFLQRGEPAILPKELRAKAAVMNGADLVIEIPSVFSCSSAEYYAFAAVSLMARLGIVDNVVFGSEDPDIDMMEKFAKILINEPDEFSVLLKTHLATGVSFAKARQLSLVEYTGMSDSASAIEGSNNILGIEYVKAIQKNQYPMKPVAIPRIAEEYKQTYIDGEYPSATAIRNSILNNGIKSVKAYLPEPTFSILDDFYKDTDLFINRELLKDAIFYRIASLTKDQLTDFPGVSEGLENRFKANLGKFGSIEDYVDACASKRYPKTRISRSLIYILLDIHVEEAHSIWNKGPLYARLLASSQDGMKLIPVLERNSSIPVFTSYNSFYKIASSSVRKLLDIEKRASDIYSTASGIDTSREYTIKFSIY